MDAIQLYYCEVHFYFGLLAAEAANALTLHWYVSGGFLGFHFERDPDCATAGFEWIMSFIPHWANTQKQFSKEWFSKLGKGEKIILLFLFKLEIYL